jgi:hypothetical protein
VPDRRASRLLGELCDAGVELGAVRLFARVPEEGEEFPIFRQVGFTPVVREYTYYRPLEGRHDVAAGEVRIPGLRRQRRSDAFGILQLYRETNPKMVELAEGKLSRSWEFPEGRLSRGLMRRSRIRRWVVEREGRAVAWLQVTIERRGTHVIRAMIDERTGDLAGQLLDFAMGVLAGQPGTGVAARVREHQALLRRALEARGFEIVDAHLLMVKQLAAPVLEHQFGRVLEKVV